MVSVSIEKAEAKYSREIVNLFNKNYPEGYYETHFSTESMMSQLLMSDFYTGLIARNEKTNEVIGFSGMKVEEKNNWQRVYLCNFLVDESYRGCGVGKQLDINLENYLIKDNIPKTTYGLVIPRTKASLKSKINQGYPIWGIRNFFGLLEPSPVDVGHLFTIGKIFNVEEETIELPYISSITKKLVESCGFKSIHYKIDLNKSSKVSVEFPKYVKYGQYGVNIEKLINGVKHIDINLVIDKVLKESDKNPYLAIRVNCNVENFPSIERELLNRRFVPTSFLPYFDFGEHMIEYQFISDEKLKDLSKELSNYSEIYSFLSKG